MLRERLKEIELKITELADYLSISRPTMYKFIEYYEEKNFNLINPKVLKLFNYINDNPLVGKRNVVNYILTNLVSLKEVGDSSEVSIINNFKKYINSNPESKKTQFLITCITKSTFDDIIPYLVSIQNLVKKRKLKDEEKELLKPYYNLLVEIKKEDSK